VGVSTSHQHAIWAKKEKKIKPFTALLLGFMLIVILHSPMDAIAFRLRFAVRYASNRPIFRRRGFAGRQTSFFFARRYKEKIFSFSAQAAQTIYRHQFPFSSHHHQTPCTVYCIA